MDTLVLWQEEDPGWHSRVPEFNPEPVVDIEMHVSHIRSYSVYKCGILCQKYIASAIVCLNIQNFHFSL